MKKSIILSAALICTLHVSFFAQSNSPVIPPSEAPHGYTYDFDKVNAIIIERLVKPSSANEIASVLIAEISFPKLVKGTEIDQEYKKNIVKWIESHQALIISTFKNRNDIVQSY